MNIARIVSLVIILITVLAAQAQACQVVTYVNLVPPAATDASAATVQNRYTWWWPTSAASSSTKYFSIEQGTTVKTAWLMFVLRSNGVGFQLVNRCLIGQCDWYSYNYLGIPFYVQPLVNMPDMPPVWGAISAQHIGVDITADFQALADQGFENEVLGLTAIGSAKIFEAYLYLVTEC